MTEPPIRDRIMVLLAECEPHFTLTKTRMPTPQDLDGITDEEADALEVWAAECRLTCIDTVDWALGPVPEPLASRLKAAVHQ